MKVLVISNPIDIANETALIHSLFEEGLELFHLRKPDYTEQEQIDFIEQIPKKYHPHIVLHQHYSLAERWDIKRLHFSAERRRNNSAEWKLRESKKYFLSTSIHTMDEYAELSEHTSYTFIGPVFDSISKKGYYANSDKIFPLIEVEKRKTKLIAIGGIEADKIEQLHQEKFDGVALLGTIWNNPEKAIHTFRTCREIALMS